MEVKLLTKNEHVADMVNFAALAYLTCHANADKEYVPSEKLKCAINAGHESILEHINLTYSVKGISRALLQELSRHRLFSLSVESTRHTLRKYLAMSEDELCEFFERHIDTLSLKIDKELIQACFGTSLGILRGLFMKGVPNDELKYFLPEFWPTNLILTTNIRELRHILKLRTAPAALKEFQDLARALFNAVPEEYRYLLEDCVYKKGGEA